MALYAHLDARCGIREVPLSRIAGFWLLCPVMILSSFKKKKWRVAYWDSQNVFGGARALVAPAPGAVPVAAAPPPAAAAEKKDDKKEKASTWRKCLVDLILFCL
jgi:hypothetical protein